jgi:hypothetical protein
VGVRNQGCLGMSNGGTVSGSLFTEGHKESQEWAVNCMGPFLLALDPFYDLTSNFSCLYNLI